MPPPALWDPRGLARRLGSGLIGPLALAAGTGAAVLLRYGTDASGAATYVGAGQAWPDFLRSLHVWASRVLLVGAVLHAAWTWTQSRWDVARIRRSHLTGTVALALLLALHGTGHVLRDDAGGRRLAADLAVPSAWTLPLHAAILPLMLVAILVVHVTSARPGPDPSPAERAAAVPSGAAYLAGGLLTGAAVLLAAAFPSADRAGGVAFPFGPFHAVAAGSGPVFYGGVALVLALVAVQPRVRGIPAVRVGSWVALAAVAALALWMGLVLPPSPP